MDRKEYNKMLNLAINETPIRTAKNFNINDTVLKELNIPEIDSNFGNAFIDIDNTKIQLSNKNEKNKLKFGVGKEFEKQSNSNSNFSLKLEINGKSSKDSIIVFNLDKKNCSLVENLEIVANENSKANIFIKYNSAKSGSFYHNGTIKIKTKENAKLKICVLNLLNEKTENFLSIENTLHDSSNLDFCIVDFGGQNSITNYYSNLQGAESNNNLNVIYLGKENQFFDLNYIGELYGEKSNMNIEVQGALNGSSKKHFKGTLDFKRGAKKAKGNENEFCMLLSKKAKAIALPMLLCEEEDVEGNHSTAAGKLDNKELFYILSRGFTKEEAMKLIVRAKFNKIIDKISNEEIKNEVLAEIDKSLS